MDDNIINENPTCGMETPQHKKGATVNKTPKDKKRTKKPKQRYSPPGQSTPKPPKRRSKNKTKTN